MSDLYPPYKSAFWWEDGHPRGNKNMSRGILVFLFIYQHPIMAARVRTVGSLTLRNDFPTDV